MRKIKINNVRKNILKRTNFLLVIKIDLLWREDLEFPWSIGNNLHWTKENNFNWTGYILLYFASPDFRKLTYSSEKNMSSRIPGFLIRHYIFSIFNWELKITVILVVRIRSRLMTIFTISQFISNLLLGEWTTRPEKVKGRKRKERTCRKSSSKPLQTGFDGEKV